MNSERLQVLFNSIEQLTQDLQSATESANKIRHINNDAVNVTETIRQFETINYQTNNLISDVNNIKKYFTKNTLIILILVFIVSIMIGCGGGYYLFIHNFQQNVMKSEMDKVRNMQDDLYNKNIFFKNSIENGVKFYNNVIVLPIKKKTITKDGYIAYWYE